MTLSLNPTNEKFKTIRLDLIALAIIGGFLVIGLALSTGVLFRDICYFPPHRLETHNFGRYYELRHQRFDWLPGSDVKSFPITEKQYHKLMSKGGISAVDFL